jgi:heat shock protein HslJ
VRHPATSPLKSSPASVTQPASGIRGTGNSITSATGWHTLPEIMRASGLRLGVAGLLAALLLSACDNGEPRDESLGLTHTPADLSELEGGPWVADSILDPKVSLVPGTQIEMRFQHDSLAVHAGCNTLFGGASIDGTDLVVASLASTKKACDASLTQQDEWLSRFLSSRPTIEVLEQDLWLSHGNDTVIHLVQQ